MIKRPEFLLFGSIALFCLGILGGFVPNTIDPEPYLTGCIVLGCICASLGK